MGESDETGPTVKERKERRWRSDDNDREKTGERMSGHV